MELGNNDALGSVDHERAVLGHQRDLAEIDLLLLDVLDRAGTADRIHVIDHQVNGDLERRRVVVAALLALIDVELRLANRIAYEIQLGRLVKVLDREDRFKDSLQADVFALFGRNTDLQEVLV